MVSSSVLGGLTSVFATIYGNGNLAISLGPLLLLLILAVLLYAPIRVPLTVLIFLSLALDATDEGPFNSVLAPIGALIVINLNKSLPISALAVPGFVLALVGLTMLHAHRVLRDVRIDTVGRVPAPPIFYVSLAVSFVAVLTLCFWGYLNGGSTQMAKIQVQTYVLVLFTAYLCAASFRDLRDYRTLGVLVLIAACAKSMYAIYVAHTITVGAQYSVDGELAVAVTHGESLLYATGFVMLVVGFAERPSKRSAFLALILLPLITGGMLANGRRIVWVEITVALILYWLVSRRSRLKRVAVHLLIASLPLFIGYVAAGWNSNAKIFGPIKTFRSVGDSEVDASTLYRDLENYNLLATLRQHPVVGSGFGHPFVEEVKLPDISFFKEYQYMPHNSLLGLWAFVGPFGFSGLMVAVTTGMFLAARSYQFATRSDERIAAFMVMGVLAVYLVHCWGDIGFSERKSLVLVGPALALAGQLATATGAWRTSRTRHS